MIATLTGIIAAITALFAGPSTFQGQGISQLEQWKATTTPYSALTTLVDGRNLYLPRSNATTSNLTASTICLTADTCRTTWPGTGSTIGTVSTSTVPTVGQLAYWTDNGYPSLLGSVATGTVASGAGISVTAGQSVIGSGLTITNTGVTSLTATSPLVRDVSTGAVTISCTSCLTAALTSLNGLSGASQTFATTSLGTGWGFDSTGTTHTLNIPTASASVPLGLLSSADWSTFNGKESALTFSTGLTRSVNTVTVNTSQNISTLSNLTGNGFVKTSGGTGALSIDTSTYLTSAGAVTSLAATYPLQTTGATGAITISTAFGTTTANTFSQTNIFSGIINAARVIISGIAAAFTPASEGELGFDTTDNQFKYYSSGAVRVVSPTLYPAFSYATSTAWTGTTTIPLGPAYVGETWAGVKCFTDAGTVNVSFNDGTNRMNMLNASTTVGTFLLTTNNSFTAGEKRYVDIGTPASSPTKISCTVAKTIDAS